MKHFKVLAAFIILIITLFPFTACKTISDNSAKKKIFDKYSRCAGFACDVTVLDGKDNEITTAYVEITGDDFSFEIKSPAVIKGIKFLQKDGDFSVRYYDLSVDLKFIPQSIKPLITVLPAAFINKDMALGSVINSTGTEYKISYEDPSRTLTLTLDRQTYALIDTVISMDNKEYTLKFKDFNFM